MLSWWPIRISASPGTSLEHKLDNPVCAAIKWVNLSLSQARKGYPDRVRRVYSFNTATGKSLVFLTNYFTFPVVTVAFLYKLYWLRGAVLQMDQAVSPNQDLLRRFQEHRVYPDLDRHPRKGAEIFPKSAHYVAW